MCPLERAREFQVWDANSVRVTVIVLESHEETSALEAAFGSRRLRISAQAGGESVEAWQALREASLSVDHASATVLTRYFASVSKIFYRMRINGDVLDHDVLASYDEPHTSAITASPGLLDTDEVHASCCALAEATRGHDTVADLIHEAATDCAPTAVTEVLFLIVVPSEPLDDRPGQHAHRIRRLGMLQGSRIGQGAPTPLDELFVWVLACGRCDMEWDTVDEKEET